MQVIDPIEEILTLALLKRKLRFERSDDYPNCLDLYLPQHDLLIEVKQTSRNVITIHGVEAASALAKMMR